MGGLVVLEPLTLANFLKLRPGDRVVNTDFELPTTYEVELTGLGQMGFVVQTTDDHKFKYDAVTVCKSDLTELQGRKRFPGNLNAKFKRIYDGLGLESQKYSSFELLDFVRLVLQLEDAKLALKSVDEDKSEKRYFSLRSPMHAVSAGLVLALPSWYASRVEPTLLREIAVYASDFSSIASYVAHARAEAFRSVGKVPCGKKPCYVQDEIDALTQIIESANVDEILQGLDEDSMLAKNTAMRADLNHRVIAARN